MICVYTESDPSAGWVFKLRAEVLRPKRTHERPDQARSYLLSKFDRHVCRIADERAKTLSRTPWERRIARH